MREIPLPPLREGLALTLRTAHAGLWRVDFGVYGSVSTVLSIGGHLRIVAGPVQPRLFVDGADLDVVDNNNIIRIQHEV